MKRLRVALLAGSLAVALVRAPVPAGAHAGGRAQLYVDSVHLAPEAGGWRAELVVRDADSGKPEPGVAVRLTATGAGGSPVGPVDLADPDGDGRYSGLLPVPAGGWTVGVAADEIPGGPRALPFSRTFPARLVTGQPLDLGASGTSTATGRHVPVVPLGGGLLAAGLLFAGWRRYRTQGLSLSSSSVVEKTPT